MTKEELKEIITNGESSKVEFKVDTIEPEELAKHIVALANFQGGYIIFGVGDDKSIVGIKKEKLEEWIMNICRNNIEPSIIPEYEEIVLEDKNLTVLKIHSYAYEKPYASLDRGRRIHYIRAGTTSRPATREEIRRLFQASGLLQFDKTHVLNCTFQDLDIEKIEEYYENKRFYDYNLKEMHQADKEKLLFNAGLLITSEKEYFATVAGVLLFGKEPEKYLPQSGITFAHFKGNDLGSSKLISTEKFVSTLPQNVDRLCAHIMNIIPRLAEIIGTQRIEKERYPHKVIREAIVNASIHRDYIMLSKIRVFLFDDRLEVKSPGRLPNDVTIDEIKVGRSAIRNPLLFQFMHRLGYIDALGWGVPSIIQKMKSLGAKEPDIIEDNEVTLIVYPPKEGI